jgi:hypothetical protein
LFLVVLFPLVLRGDFFGRGLRLKVAPAKKILMMALSGHPACGRLFSAGFRENTPRKKALMMALRASGLWPDWAIFTP